MPRYSKYEHIYIKDTVWFEEFLPVKFRKGKRIVLAFLDHILKNNLEFSVDNFNDFLSNVWWRLRTINRPLPYKLGEIYRDSFTNNIFDTTSDDEMHMF
jgi:hypothetical protein